MTTSATTAPALMAFPRYPELPPELRLTVIEETLDSLPEIDQWACAKGDFPMSRYASIDRQWNRVVELRLFKDIELFPWKRYSDWTLNSNIQQELFEFGAICGKRPGRLSRVLLNLHDFDQASFENHLHLQILFQLFDLMKSWDRGDREQQGLIELWLDFQFIEHSSPWMDEHALDLDRFPEVSVIGSIQEPRHRYRKVHLHPCVLAALCQKLPSVCHAGLTLPSGSSEHVSTGDFIRAMDLLRIDKPGLTHLDLRTYRTSRWRSGSMSTLLPVIQRLSVSPSPWSNRLVSLTIHHNIVVQDFLRDASKVVWPNLNAIKLVGALDIENHDGGIQANEDDGNAVADESSGKIIRALIMALPSMPKATKFQIEMFPNMEFPWRAFEISIHFGNIVKTKKAGKVQQPCAASFAPDSNSGIARMSDIYPPGSTTIQLQDVVRVQRRQKLEVFACGEDGYCHGHHNPYMPHRPCARWDRRTEGWEAVFRNDMDIFIYGMGQYWEAVERMDNVW